MRKSRMLSLAGLFAAVIAICSLTSIPMPSGTPITLQTLAIALAGYMLGARYAFVCVLVYLALGAVGLPVFSGLTGGVGRFVGVTGGFLWGFMPMAALCGLGAKAPFARGLGWGLLGLITCHIAGVIQFALVTGNTVPSAFMLCSLPYLWKDIASVAGAKYLARLIARRTHMLGERNGG